MQLSDILAVPSSQQALEGLTLSLQSMNGPSLLPIFVYGQDDAAIEQLFVDLDGRGGEKDHHRPFDAIFLGFELISRVPSQLHTPLMSGSNAISGITIVGALIAAGTGEGKLVIVLGTLAVAFAMINVVGGYLVTDRMLGMFKHKDGGSQ